MPLSKSTIDQIRKEARITKISKTALKDFYELRSFLNVIHQNELQDVGNRNRADKRNINNKKAVAICEKWINANPPIELD